MPQLVVKIIGGKHIRNFTDAVKSPTDDATNSSEEKQSLHTKDTQEDLGRKSSSDLELLRAEEHTKNLLASIRQVPDRQCVTAPCGDRSGSYIHLKTNVTNTKQLLTHTNMLIKTNTESCLLSAIYEELQGLDSQITQNIEKKLMDLDPSHSGIIHQSELTYLLLKQKIPLKLTTLSCIFKSFSDANNPEKVDP
nr:uncharacterized protein C1orf87 homolog [Misgurnus anguillicaudatus]